jgi:putative SOS response-associated peptidase YedK
MCGRYNLKTSAAELSREFHALIQRELDFTPRWNISPTQFVPIIRESSEGREISTARWGLVPSWAKDTKLAASMINARSETVAEKPAFRSAFRRRRCLIPMDGFYEWKVVPGQKLKQPLEIRRASGGLIGLAGLWESWRDPAGNWLETTSIITTSANELMAQFHDRMPVLIAATDYDAWLNPESVSEQLLELLRPCPADELVVTEADPERLRRGCP